MDTDKLEQKIMDFLNQGKFTRVRKDGFESFIISHKDIDEDLASDLLTTPDAVLGVFNHIALQSASGPDVDKVNVRIKDLPKITRMRGIGAKNVGKLVCLEGTINRITVVEEAAKVIAWQCKKCEEITHTTQKELFGETKPFKCSHGKCRGKIFDKVIDESEFIDIQRLSLQEPQHHLPAGQIPRLMPLILLEDLINGARAGDDVKVTGIIKLEETGGKKKLYRHWILVNHIDVLSKESSEVELSMDDEKMLFDLSQDPKIIPKLIVSIARTIHGYYTIKEAILYTLFGGVTKTPTPDRKTRGEIHILLVGDPAVAKSQLLRSVAKIAPRAIYTSGKGATAAGLTAAVVQTKGELPSLEVGALVLADRGIACIDEIDKMNANDRIAIHEAMAQQTISINKWGINVTLPAQTSIIASGNPTYGRYDDSRNLAENIDNLPVTLLSRFDLIFTIRDLPDEALDKERAEFVLQVAEGELNEKGLIPIPILRKYIAYGRRINPKLTQNAHDMIKKCYSDLRKEGKARDAFSITLRHLEGLVRMAEAHARARLSSKVEKEDAQSAIDIMNKALDNYIDPITHERDIDQMFTGKTKTQQNDIKVALEILREHQNDHPFGLKKEEWVTLLGDHMTEERAEQAIMNLRNKNKIQESRIGCFKGAG